MIFSAPFSRWIIIALVLFNATPWAHATDDGYTFNGTCYTDTATLDSAWQSQYPLASSGEVWRLTSFSSSSVSGHTISYTLAQSIGSGSVSSSFVPAPCDSSIMVSQHLLHQIFDIPSPDDYTVAFAAGFMPLMLIFLGMLGVKYILELLGWMGDRD